MPFISKLNKINAVFSSEKGNNIFPFTEEAIGLISEKSEFNASSILERAYGLIESAVNENINLIDVDFLDKVSKMYLHEAVSVLWIRYYYSFAVLNTFILPHNK